MKKIIAISGILLMMTMATACGTPDEATHEEHTEAPTEAHEEHEAAPKEEQEEHAHDEHAHMNHGGEVPEGLEPADNPTFPVGTHVTIEKGHMAGMEGAEATIVGAYDTTAYTVTYTPITGGEPVVEHKWVIHEELADAGAEPLVPGTEVVLNTEHLPGMKGAAAIIESAEQTTVYVIDYTPTTGGERVENHLWVTEDELAELHQH